ncbi:cytidylate kinase-like family protein [Candidatus Bathyarchaeota archaeon]|nr:cytidylate kinase-like family protein [Candidatus Bathyarchaeota archaeon]
MHIAICGELGAGCTEVGQLLSEMLGIKVINSATIVKSIVTDLRGVYPDESFGEFKDQVLSGEVDLDKMIAGEIQDFLEQGDTIVEGRSAFMLLNRNDVFKVLLVCPLEKRAKHIAKRRQISIGEAKEDIRISDSERQHMVEKMFKAHWLDPHYYDIIINTGLYSFDETAKQIRDLVQKKVKNS